MPELSFPTARSSSSAASPSPLPDLPSLSRMRQGPPEFAALAEEYAEVLAGPAPGLPPDRGLAIELHIDTGSHPMPRSRPMKLWSQGKLEECSKQVARTFLLDQGWIIPSRTSHAASVVFARKANGTWRFCHDYRGLNAIMQKSESVELLQHVDQLIDITRGARFFTGQARFGGCLHAVPDPCGGSIKDLVSRPRQPVRVPGRRLRLT